MEGDLNFVFTDGRSVSRIVCCQKLYLESLYYLGDFLKHSSAVDRSPNDCMLTFVSSLLNAWQRAGVDDCRIRSHEASSVVSRLVLKHLRLRSEKTGLKLLAQVATGDSLIVVDQTACKFHAFIKNSGWGPGRVPPTPARFLVWSGDDADAVAVAKTIHRPVFPWNL